MSNYEKVKKWRELNPEKVLEQARRYRSKHPETNKKAKAKYREANLDKIRELDKLSQATRRKLDPEGQKKRYESWRIRHEARLWEKAGKPRAEQCEICSADEMTVFDHCHATDKFRGWICDRCNKVLGLIKDSADLLRKLANYLENFDDSLNNKETECATEV